MRPFIEKIAKKNQVPCPGGKIRSDGEGRGLGLGKGNGPRGIPIGKKMKKEGAFHATLEKLGLAKAPSLWKKVKSKASTAGKYAKWGGLGMGVYLALKALEGAGEAKQEAVNRW